MRLVTVNTMEPMQTQKTQVRSTIHQPLLVFMMTVYLMPWWMLRYLSTVSITRDIRAVAMMVVMSPCTALHVSDLSVWSPGSPPCMVTNTGVLRLVTRGSTVSARARLAINRMDRRRVVAWGGKTSHFMDTLFIYFRGNA